MKSKIKNKKNIKKSREKSKKFALGLELMKKNIKKKKNIFGKLDRVSKPSQSKNKRIKVFNKTVEQSKLIKIYDIPVSEEIAGPPAFDKVLLQAQPKTENVNYFEPKALDLFDKNGNLVILKAAKAEDVPEDIQNIDSHEAEIKVFEDIFAPNQDLSPQNTLIDIKLQSNIEKKFKMPSQHQNLHSIGKLSVFSALNFILWPFKQAYKIIYWPFKLHIIERKQKKYQKKYQNFDLLKNNEPEDIFAPLPYINFLNLAIPRQWYKVLLIFIVACVTLIFPLQVAVYYQSLDNVKSDIESNAQRAFDNLKAGEESIAKLDLDSAIASFQNAQKDFFSAQANYNNLDFFTKSLINIIPLNKNIKLGLSLLDTGESVAKIGENLTNSAKIFYNGNALESNWQNNFLDNIYNLHLSLSVALPKVAQAETIINNLSENNSDLTNSQEFIEAARTLPDLKSKLANFNVLAESLLKILGYNQWQRYLVLFENNNELRATGGFIGSYALLDVDNGKIKNIEIPPGGSYDLQGSLLPLIASPEPLHMISPIWQFQDSNWWPDFPTSAKKIIWFYENAKGPSVDGVVVITASFMENLLGLVGPVAMDDYGRIIDQDNFITATQNIVELEYDKIENKPKQFIADLAPKILEKISVIPKEKILDLLDTFYQGLKEKQIMLYSTDQEIQRLYSELDFAGNMKASYKNDYLSVINTNLAGGKTDGVIVQSIKHQSEINSAGKIIDTVIVNKIHNGQKPDVFFGVQNNSYIRFYVPKGSKFLEAEGFGKPESSYFESVPAGYLTDKDLTEIEGKHLIDPESGTEIYDELDKTVFANWLSIKPGEQKAVMIKYELPYTIDEMNGIYAILIQKQAGTINDDITSDLIIDGDYSILDSYPGSEDSRISIEKENNIINFSDKLTTDRFYGVTLKK